MHGMYYFEHNFYRFSDDMRSGSKNIFACRASSGFGPKFLLSEPPLKKMSACAHGNSSLWVPHSTLHQGIVSLG